MRTDEEIVKLCQEGQGEHFEELVNRHGPSLYGYLRRLLFDPTLAEDVYQDVFLKIIQKIKEFKFQGKFKNWMYTIAHSTAIDKLKREKIRKTTSLDIEVKGMEDSEKLKDMLPNNAPTPHEYAVDKETMERLKDAEDELSPVLKEVYMLRKYSEMKFKDIATMLKCPEGTVLSRMHLAIKDIRSKLELEVGGEKVS